MARQRWKFVYRAIGILGCALAAPFAAVCQEAERSTKDDAALVVEGLVRQAYRSTDEENADSLVEIEVLRCEGRKSAGRASFPGPGESVYVHVPTRRSPTARLAPRGSDELPSALSKVRVYLTPRSQGGWAGASADWFEVIAERAGDADIATGAADAAGEVEEIGGAESLLGMTADVLKVENRTALRVTSLERGGAAQSAGLEVGDVIFGVNGDALESAEQVEQFATKGEAFSLLVVDVNTGKAAQVEIAPQQKTDEEVAPAQPKVSLGMSADPVKLGTRSALKVTRVEAGGAAAKAGIEVGDLIVAANGAAITGPDQLISALRKSGSNLKLTVRDSRTKRDVDVDVALAGASSAKPLPDDVDVPSPAANNANLGAVVELAFHDSEFAVKVTEVEIDSPASRAGLLPGTLILAANGKAVLHPNDVSDAARNAKGKLKLTIVDPVTSEKGELSIDLAK